MLRAENYSKPGMADGDNSRDGADCEMKAKVFAQGAGWAVYAGQYNSMYDSCMRSKGYSR